MSNSSFNKPINKTLRDLFDDVFPIDNKFPSSSSNTVNVFVPSPKKDQLTDQEKENMVKLYEAEKELKKMEELVTKIETEKLTELANKIENLNLERAVVFKDIEDFEGSSAGMAPYENMLEELKKLDMRIRDLEAEKTEMSLARLFSTKKMAESLGVIPTTKPTIMTTLVSYPVYIGKWAKGHSGGVMGMVRDIYNNKDTNRMMNVGNSLNEWATMMNSRKFTLYLGKSAGVAIRFDGDLVGFGFRSFDVSGQNMAFIQETPLQVKIHLKAISSEVITMIGKVGHFYLRGEAEMDEDDTNGQSWLSDLDVEAFCYYHTDTSPAQELPLLNFAMPRSLRSNKP